jgi:tripartite-type tricarboxylate transporter receptor subunit TctC
VRKLAAIALAAIIADGAAVGAMAQDYPERVVQIIVPASPGSSADIIGRALAEGLSTQFGKRFIVVDRVGASGVVGTADVARANPDGYTLMHGAAVSVTLVPLVDKQAGYTAQSFTPICQTFKNDQVVVVPPNSPLKTARDIVEAARRKPGALTVGLPSIASIPHLAMLALAAEIKAGFNDIPFKGPAEEIQSVRSGEIDLAAVPLTAAAGSGLAMPGIFASERNPGLPDVPTFKEQGYDVAPLSYGGLLAPAGVPDEVVRKLDNACSAAMKSDLAQGVARRTLQPADYFADSAGFTRNLAVDLAEKKRLAPMLGQTLQ